MHIRDPAGATANVSGRFPANYPNTWLRLKRAGNSFTGFASYDGQAWTSLGSATISMPSQVYVGLAASSHNTNQLTAARFEQVAQPVTNAGAATTVNPHEPLGPCSRLTPFVISEIMYKPAPRTDGNNTEFIELYNSNPYFEDLSGFQITGSINYTFPPGTILGGGGFLVLAASPASIQNVYGITNVTGPYTGSLKKSGTIELIDAQGGIVLTIPYSNLYPWPVAPTAPAIRWSWPIPPMGKATRAPGISATWSAVRPARAMRSAPARCARSSSTKCWPTPKTPPFPSSSSFITTAPDQ